MPDTRIRQIHDAMLQMRQGVFHVHVPAGPEDEVGLLGKALTELGQTLESRFRELQALTLVTEKINSGLLLDDVLNHVYDAFDPLLPFDRIGFSLLEENDQGEVIARARWFRPQRANTQLGAGYSAPLRGSSLERVVNTGRPRILNDLEAYLAEHPNSESTRLIVAEGVRASLTCPLVALGKPVGFMFFSSFEKNAYKDAHVELFLGIAGQLSTIVEKSRLYQELLELNELKSRFIGIAAHDLRSPLTVIKGYADLLGEGVAGKVSDRQRGILGNIDQACERMLALINDLLDVSVIESGKLELDRSPVPFSGYLEEVRGTQEILAQAKGIHLRLEVPEGLPAVSMDVHRMGEVFDNLLSNAFKFSEPGSEVILRAEPYRDGVKVLVIDEGPGIAEDEVPKLFGAFQRGSSRTTGGESSTGLGLAIVKRLVEAHGGHIWIESTLGEGASFIFTLPSGAAA